MHDIQEKIDQRSILHAGCQIICRYGNGEHLKRMVFPQQRQKIFELIGLNSGLHKLPVLFLGCADNKGNRHKRQQHIAHCDNPPRNDLPAERFGQKIDQWLCYHKR